MQINVPGREPISFNHLVVDYNGTIAVDGQIIPSLIPLIQRLQNKVHIHVLTADTFGTVREQCANLSVEVQVFPSDAAAESKRAIVRKLEGQACCFGNGFNDRLMFEDACLSVGIIEREGLCTALLLCADVLVTHAEDAFNLLLEPQRLIATLRG